MLRLLSDHIDDEARSKVELIEEEVVWVDHLEIEHLEIVDGGSPGDWP